MVERDIVLAKGAIVERCLQRIADVRGTRRAVLNDEDVLDITVLNLQRATQACIDLASHIVATEAYGLPDSLAATFALLEERGVISGALAGRLRKMVGFRNVAVHDYQRIDPVIVDAIVVRHVADLRDFVAVVVGTFLPVVPGA